MEGLRIMQQAEDLLKLICDENLAVYNASPIRLREDVSQEAIISNDYRGRLVYELLQNADDAMVGQAVRGGKVVFRLTDEELWIGNSGRPLTDFDVKGLCGIGASRKGDTVERRRASIGHKGMGFKSVLEITDSPEIISDDYAFKMSAQFGRAQINAIAAKLSLSTPERVPIMRFPSRLQQIPAYWDELRKNDIHTLFRLPLRTELTDEQRSILSERLLNLPLTTILFLKHLESVEVVVQTGERSDGYIWTLKRQRWTKTGWVNCTGLSDTGIYRTNIESSSGEAYAFLLAHDADIEIDENRGGLNTYAWEGVEVSEVSIATLLDGNIPKAPPPAWRQFHVFLPTSEMSPYPLLVNGAFESDLSRQEIRISDEATDYNRFLMHRVARLFRNVLVAHLQYNGASTADILRMVDRKVAVPGTPAHSAAGQALYSAMRAELSSHPLLPLQQTTERLTLNSCVVPPLVPNNSVGEEFRKLLGSRSSWKDRQFPDESVCGSALAAIIVDHGALELAPREAAEVLACGDLEKVRLEEHESGGIYVDPVLRVLEGLWDGLDSTIKDQFAESVRRSRLFPIGKDGNVIQRVSTDGIACFYPPRTLKGTVPLDALCFMMQELCWGALLPIERNIMLGDQLVSWQALFELREFKFPEVMRASVLPALELAPDQEGQQRLKNIQKFDALAAICQLSGRTPDPRRPLPYERLGTNRALFNLCRLRVPCRVKVGLEFEWRPAYQVYLGADWIGDASIERVLSATTKHGAKVPQIPLLAGPEYFDGLLARFRDLEQSTEGDDEGEVSLDEDEEAPPDQQDRERWITFLTWLGVNRVIRPVHFHDVEDHGTGWLKTKDLHRPDGWAFQQLSSSFWDDFQQQAHRALKQNQKIGAAFFYRVHDLEYIVPFLRAAAEDSSADIAKVLFAHLALNWEHLETFVKAEAAVVPADRVPNMRAKPQRAYEDEVETIGDDLWVKRLREHDWCPTTHGPRRPGRVWLHTPEDERRFGRQSGQLLPLLDADHELTRGTPRGLAQALGIRIELTLSSFSPEDARYLLNRLSDLYDGLASSGALTDHDLRQVVRPTYRNLMELLTGIHPGTSQASVTSILAGAPLLVHDSRGHYKFEQSDQVFYVDRPGTRERLGTPENLWTFVLESTPAARGPLTNFLKVRVLEDELTWTPQPGDPALDVDGMNEFRAGLRDLAPYILARLSAERQDEQDIRRLRDFIDAVEPVSELSVHCRFQERQFVATASRNAFVEVSRGSFRAFVVWGQSAWPPVTEEAEALAMALSDLLGIGHFEAFLALIKSPSYESRHKLLRVAGAQLDLEAAQDALKDDREVEADQNQDSALESLKSSGELTNEETAVGPSELSHSNIINRTPLFRPDEIFVNGMPIAITGDEMMVRGRSNKIGRHSNPSGAHTRSYGGNTDLSELDRLGMYVTLTFERARLRREGHNAVEILDCTKSEDQPNALVFDVSTLIAIDRAHASSQRFRKAFSYLEKQGVSMQAPGFDVLTLNPQRPNYLDRLIELKSSGVNARLQEMSWNEWKTARNSELRKIFYLYLVGNLRNDLGDSVPFIRVVGDPFASIMAEEVEQNLKSRKIQLNLTQFTTAEHLNLQVRRMSGSPPTDAPDLSRTSE